MMRLLPVFLISVSALTLASCSSPEAEQKPAEPTPSAMTQPVKTTTQLSGFSGLLDVIEKTEVEIKAKKFGMAKDEFSKFEGFWKTVEDGVKVKSKDTYNAIEDDMATMTQKIAAKDTAGSLSTLQSLRKNVKSFSK